MTCPYLRRRMDALFRRLDVRAARASCLRGASHDVTRRALARYHDVADRYERLSASAPLAMRLFFIRSMRTLLRLHREVCRWVSARQGGAA